MGLRHNIFTATYPAFALAMRLGFVRSIMDRIPPILLISPYYMRWYEENVSYPKSDHWKYHADYWNTVGQWRWQQKISYADMVETLARHTLPEDKTLIDVGCGNGAMMAELAKHYSFSMTGIDAAPRMCEQAEKIPGAFVICAPYGPGLKIAPADIVIARSTLTCIDESEIVPVLNWLSSITGRLLIIADPSAIHDEELIAKGSLHVERVSDTVYKRHHDHTHIRDYAKYEIPGFTLSETLIERENSRGSRQWVFHRISNSARTIG